MSTNFGDMADETLMQALSAGSHDVLKVLISRHKSNVYSFCFAFIRNHKRAEEFACETFILVFRDCKQYQPITKFSTWLYKIAANLCIDELKNRRAR